VADVQLLSCALRGAPLNWPHADAEGLRLYEAARRHGVHLLLAGRLAHDETSEACPQSLRDRLRSSLRNQIVVDEITWRELRAVLAALHDRNVYSLVLKGAALAFTHYPDPTLRPRADTDLLVEETQQHAACEILEQLGYRRMPLTSGELVTYQVFAHALRWDDLLASSERIPRLGGTACGLGAVHALTLACVHRVAHHAHEERLIWIYDIHLLAERLTDNECERFIDLVTASKLTAVCAQGLARAADLFQGAGAIRVLADLRTHRPTTVEPSASFTAAKMRKLDVLVSDLRALGGWPSRLRLLREHIFPPRAYMRAAYGTTTDGWLPLLYVWRFVRGAAVWCRQRSA